MTTPNTAVSGLPGLATTLQSRAPRWGATLLACTTLLATVSAQMGTSGVTELVSRRANGTSTSEVNGGSSFSKDNRFICFGSLDALVPEDTNAEADAYVLDRQTGDLVCATTSTGGTYGNGLTNASMISANGRYVVFKSVSDNLVLPDTGSYANIYVKDLETGVLVRVDNAMGSPDSGNGQSADPSITGDGRFVVFRSSASDLVPGDTNGMVDIFRFDTWSGTMLRVSNGPAGQGNGDCYSPSVSGSGSRIAFSSEADNLTIGDTNGYSDVFIVDVAGLPTMISRNGFGLSANASSRAPQLSASGRHLVFTTAATDLPIPTGGVTQVLAVNLDSMEFALVTADPLGQPSSDISLSPTISADGRYVAFLGFANGMAPYESEHTDVFVRDMEMGQTWTGSRPSGVSGTANGSGSFPTISPDGSLLGFTSGATNMVPGDVNGYDDVFIRVMHPDPAPYCSATASSGGCLPSLTTNGFPSSGTDAGFTLFVSDVPNQSPGFVFYGFHGPAETPFHGGTLCVETSLNRGPMLWSGGSPVGSDCSGTYAIDMNAYASGALGGSPHIGLSSIGDLVNVQILGRDGGNVFLSNAVEYVVGP